MRLRLIRLETTIPYGNSTGDEQYSDKALLTALILFVKVVKKARYLSYDQVDPAHRDPTVSFVRKPCWVRLGTGFLCNCKAKSNLYSSLHVVKIMNKFLTQQLMGSRDPFVPPLLLAFAGVGVHQLE